MTKLSWQEYEAMEKAIVIQEAEIARLRAALQEIEKSWCTANVNALVNAKSCDHCIARAALETTTSPKG